MPTNGKNVIPIFIQEHNTKKCKLRSIWQRTSDPDAKTPLNKQTALVKDLLHTTRKNEWTSFLGLIDNNSQG